jgi:hypothetical protein
MVSRTTRGYRSGGTCSTDWRTTLQVAVAENGSLSGTGTAKLTSGPNCPFVTGQPQLRRFDVRVSGSTAGRPDDLRLTAEPHGTGIDYGGFDEAFQDGRTLDLTISKESASGHSVIRVVPADPTDTAIVRNSIHLRRKGS